MRIQLEILEHHADPGAQRGQIGLLVADRHAVDRDPALLKRLQPVHAFDERGFARSGRAADDHDGALIDPG